MKNIHTLPTNKPSRVHLVEDKLEITNEYKFSVCDTELNIYITSDEELPYDSSIFDSGAFYHRDAAGDIHIITKHTFKPNPHFCKRIILTTDQDLIKDSIQAIDDEFLEWFVKNPSCEEVEVDKMLQVRHGVTWYDLPNQKQGNESESIYRTIYKIFFPKEEPKQETLEETFKKFEV